MSEPRHQAADRLEPRLSTADAARFLGVSRRYVGKLIDARVLPAWNVGPPGGRPRWAVSAESVRELLRQGFRAEEPEEPKEPEEPAQVAPNAPRRHARG